MKTGTLTNEPAAVPIAETENMIRHFALIPDGNRRWGREKGLAPGEGHRVAFLEKAPELLQHLWKKGVHTATLWMFSHDNWKRSAQEVSLLMELYEQFLTNMMRTADELNVALVHTGRKDRLPDTLLQKVHHAELATEQHREHMLLFALDYSGRDELLRTINRIISDNKPNEPITAEKLNRLLDTAQAIYPDPDIVVRTSGETRTSGFMPWQSAYSEYFFSPKYFPDLLTEDLDEVLQAYQLRSRRYGS